ncbi:alpha-L-fucosidase [Chitinophaga sp. 212800010-3]|uniref:alpha-L-fucosidase n=1 Tax=unclassified Chitinophaga TaxID=2619133 RepID=UPI002DF31903|nr:Alpha-L-fucosidase [Chitinophaga sp. 212800010-3]
MKKSLLTVFAIFITAAGFCQTTLTNPRTDKKLLKNFQDARLGLFVHWMACFTPATGDSWEIGRKTSKATADSISFAWNPEKFDAKAIVDFAVKAGCKYITVIAKHHDGFCIWDSKYTDFDVTKTAFKKDILAELGAEARRRGLLYGIYYSIGDIHECEWTKIPYGGEIMPEPKGGKSHFVSFVHSQVKELIKKYNPDMLWFDGFWLGPYWTQQDGRDLYADIRQTKSATLSRGLSSTRDAEDKHDIFIPDGASGDYLCMEAKTSEGPDYPWEACTSVSYPVYAYDPNAQLLSKKELITMFSKVICGNGNLLLNIGPDRDGSLPSKLTNRFMEMSEWILKNKEAVYNTAGGPFKQGDWGGSTYKANKIFLHLRGNQQQVSINKLKGYKVLSATEITSGKKLNITESGKGYNIEIPKNFEGVDIPVIALTLNKQFVFTHWLSIQ